MVNNKSDPLLPGRAQFAYWLSQQTPRKVFLTLLAMFAMLMFIVVLTYSIMWIKCMESDGWGSGRENVCTFNGRVADWGPPKDQQPDAYNVRGIPLIVDRNQDQ